MSYEENTEFPCREVPERPIATYQPWWYPMSPKDGNPSPYGPPNHQMYPNPYWNGKSNTQPHIYGFKDPSASEIRKYEDFPHIFFQGKYGYDPYKDT